MDPESCQLVSIQLRRRAVLSDTDRIGDGLRFRRVCMQLYAFFLAVHAVEDCGGGCGVIALVCLWWCVIVQAGDNRSNYLAGPMPSSGYLQLEGAPINHV